VHEKNCPLKLYYIFLFQNIPAATATTMYFLTESPTLAATSEYVY